MLDFFKKQQFLPDPDEMLLCLFMYLIDDRDGGIPRVCSPLLLQIIVANLIVLKGLSVIWLEDCVVIRVCCKKKQFFS